MALDGSRFHGELYPEIAGDTYDPMSRLREYVGQDVVLCSLIVVTRMHTLAGGAP